MESAEASGKTVDDALNRAIAKLGVTRDEVEFVVLDEGQKGGLFGRGARDAVVRVDRISGERQPDDRTEELPDTRIPRASTTQGASRRGGQRQDSGSGGRGAPRGSRPPRSDQRPRGRTGLEQPEPKLTEADFVRAPSFDADGAPLPPPSAPKPQAAPRSRDRSKDGDRPPKDRDRDRERRRRDDEPPVDPDINAEEVDFAATVVDDLLQILDINAEINIREPLTPGDGLGAALAVIDVKGEDLGLLIGRRGDTLVAMQYLVNLIVTRRFPGRPGITLDVEHYKHRREEQILSLAQRMADRVRETGSPITLEPMSAAERRIIHLALAEDEELETNSTGEGESRKVVISRR